MAPQQPLAPHAPAGAAGARRLLQTSEVSPAMAGAVLEVYWEAPPGAQPPTGWYTAVVQKMSLRGTTQLFYERSQAIETLDGRELQACSSCVRAARCWRADPRPAQNLIKRGMIAVLRPPPTQQTGGETLEPAGGGGGSSQKRKR